MSFFGALVLFIGYLISCYFALQIGTTEELAIITAIFSSVIAICVEMNEINNKNNKNHFLYVSPSGQKCPLN